MIPATACNSLGWNFTGFLVREEGFEPPRVLPRQVLSLLRLPFRHSRNDGRIIPQNWLRLPSWVIEAPLNSSIYYLQVVFFLSSPYSSRCDQLSKGFTPCLISLAPVIYVCRSFLFRPAGRKGGSDVYETAFAGRDQDSAFTLEVAVEPGGINVRSGSCSTRLSQSLITASSSRSMMSGTLSVAPPAPRLRLPSADITGSIARSVSEGGIVGRLQDTFTPVRNVVAGGPSIWSTRH
jgi:hypothetical protein